MPEAPLYPAPSHALLAPTLITTTETTVISNGNHLVIPSSAQETTTTLTTAAAVAATTITTTTTTTTITNNSGSSCGVGAINIFSQCQKRICSSKSSTGSGIMGGVDSKQQPSDSKLNALFDVYKDETEDAILAEGIEDLCRDLQVRFSFSWFKVYRIVKFCNCVKFLI